MIDIHSHLLPGVDDGSPSADVSVPVLNLFDQQGVDVLVLTPHLNASNAHQAPYEQHQAILTELRKVAPAKPELRLGWEIMLDVPGVDLTDPNLTLGNSRALLVEFTRGGVPRQAGAEFKRIARSGRTAILAHPERYFGCTVQQVLEWRSLGVVIQTDVSVLMGRGAPAELAREMLARGLIDILASDNHGDHRTLSAARDWLAEHGGEEQVDLLTHGNAERVLSDEDPLPVPPLKSLRGPMAKLRSLFRK
ncbi:MAG: CpsB/CapC family capsule biosynthesis tyrosine phosphatase [Gemmatimonadaceae bacterium]